MAKTVLFLFPTCWDERQLAACRERWAGRYEVAFAGPRDADCPWDFDAFGLIDEACRTGGALAGVASSSDYPGAAVAAAVAARLGLPGPGPAAVLTAAHKYASRLVQRAAVPEATPPFALVDPERPAVDPAVGYPCFVKPVKGSFSLFARRVEDPAELAELFAAPAVGEFRRHFVRLFQRLLAEFTAIPVDAGWFLAEGLVPGRQVTLEAYRRRGRFQLLGIVDSDLDPATGSFLRFDYPSALPAPVQLRMADVADRVTAALGLEEATFNLELTWEPALDRIAVIEVNPRLCGQFADLYAKVDGTNGYEVALALAAGDEPPAIRPGGGPFAAAASFPLRLFQPARVEAAPDAADLAEAEALFPETLVWSEVAPGDELADFSFEDGASVRYAVVNLGGAGRADLADRLEAVRTRLGYRFAALQAAAGVAG